MVRKLSGNSVTADWLRFSLDRIVHACAAFVNSSNRANQFVLAWRKSRGRDIEEEEKYEFDEADIISLRPRQSHEHSSTYRR